MKMNRLVKFCMMVAMIAIVFGVYASNSYGQETSTTDETIAPASPTYVDAGTGYKIGGEIVLAHSAGDKRNINISLGVDALAHNSGGFSNTASGYQALYENTTGAFNMANGSYALAYNTTGSSNTASGVEALYYNTTGSVNTASGVGALINNNNGEENTASGAYALLNNTTGGNNTAIGYQACRNLGTGNNVICIGWNVGPAGDIPGPATYIGGIYGAPTTGSGNPLVCIDSTGLLGTTGCAATEMIETLQRQNEELQQRISRLEALIAKK
jgi:hypothetical protein